MLCDPENGWNEIITDDDLDCASPLARRWEMVLRKELFWSREMKDDKVVEPFFEIGVTHTEDDWGLQARARRRGRCLRVEAGPARRGGHREAASADLEVDEETTAATIALARDWLLEIRRAGVWWWTLA